MEGHRDNRDAAMGFLAEGDLLHAQVHAILYVGEQIEQSTAFNEDRFQKLTDALKGRVDEVSPGC